MDGMPQQEAEHSLPAGPRKDKCRPMECQIRSNPRQENTYLIISLMVLLCVTPMKQFVVSFSDAA